MTLTRRVALNTILQIVGKVIVTAFSLFVVAILTRYLGVSGYGEYTIIFTYVSFWAILADFGFFWVLVREISKPNTDHEEIFHNVITLKALFGLVVFILCSLVGFLIPQYSWTVKIGVALISASWFWMSLNSTYVGLLQSKLEMYKASISEIVGRLIILVGVYYLIRINASLYGILWIYIIGNLVNFLISLYFGSKYIKFRFRYNPKMWLFILKESTPLLILSFVGMIHFKIDTVILSLMKGATDVGIYGVPSKIFEIILLVPGIFVGNVFPILTQYYHNKDERLNSSIQKTFDFLVVIAIPIVVGLVVLAWPIINFIAGSEYLKASSVSIGSLTFPAPRILIILAISVGFSCILNIFSNLLTILGKQRSQVMPMIVITVINVTLNIILIPRYSYLAAAVVNCFTNLIMFFWWSHLTHRYLKFKLEYNITSKVLFASLVMGLLLYFFRSYNILLTTSLGIITYFSVCLIIKVFDINMLRQMFPKFNKGK